MGNLITRLKFNLPTVFSEIRKLYFDSPFELMQFLELSGQGNCLENRREGVHKDTLFSAAAIY